MEGALTHDKNSLKYKLNESDKLNLNETISTLVKGRFSQSRIRDISSKNSFFKWILNNVKRFLRKITNLNSFFNKARRNQAMITIYLSNLITYKNSFIHRTLPKQRCQFFTLFILKFPHFYLWFFNKKIRNSDSFSMFSRGWICAVEVKGKTKGKEKTDGRTEKKNMFEL